MLDKLLHLNAAARKAAYDNTSAVATAPHNWLTLKRAVLRWHSTPRASSMWRMGRKHGKNSTFLQVPAGLPPCYLFTVATGKCGTKTPSVLWPRGR